MAYTGVEIICKDCFGTGYRRGGIPPVATDVCGDCEGTGYVARGVVKLDLASELSDIMSKCVDIKEKVDEIKAVVDAL